MCHIIQFCMTVYWLCFGFIIKHSFKLIIISVDMIDPAVVYHCCNGWETGWESLYLVMQILTELWESDDPMRQFVWVERNFWLAQSPSKVQQNLTDLWLLGKARQMSSKSGDGRYTTRDVAKAADISLSRVHLILKRILKVWKISARRIPRILMDDQKMGTSTNHWAIVKLFPKSNQILFARLIHVLLLVKKNGYTISNQ